LHNKRTDPATYIYTIKRKIVTGLNTTKLLFVCIFLMTNIQASSQTQFEYWPEINGFIRLNDQFRVYLVSAYAKGKESELRTLDMAANVDISLKPILRKGYRREDWQRTRYLWVRLGYDYVAKQVSEEKSSPENRGMINVFGKVPIPADIWLETRARADLRWIGGDYSTRYRLRFEATREFNIINHSLVPYLNCEAFYDTRYSGWSRLLIMAGAEFTISKYFRFELYLAPQFDYLPETSNLLALGMVGKVYF
jgi:hypothetical protein